MGHSVLCKGASYFNSRLIRNLQVARVYNVLRRLALVSLWGAVVHQRTDFMF